MDDPAQTGLVLTREELRAISGYRQRTKIVHWLIKNGFRPKLGRDGWPRIDRDVYREIMRGSMKRRAAEPNFEVLKCPTSTASSKPVRGRARAAATSTPD